MQGCGWIQEKTEKEALQEAKKLVKSGTIKDFGEVERIVIGHTRTKPAKPIYHYRIHCFN